jgi:hypothetical protein
MCFTIVQEASELGGAQFARSTAVLFVPESHVFHPFNRIDFLIFS